MFEEDHKFQEPLHIEFLKIERKRVGVILILFVISSLLIPLIHHTFPSLLRNFSNKPEFAKNVLFWWLLFLLFEGFVFIRLNWSIKNNHTFFKGNLIVNLIIEFGLFAIILFNTIRYDYSLLVMEYDGLTFYFVLVMLSAMHLDFYISFGAGVLACVGYFLVAFFGIEYLNMSGDISQLIEIYSMRSVGFLMVGIVAGIVASEIQRRVNNLLKAKDDQNEMESLLGQQLSTDVARELILHRNDKVGRKISGSIMFMDIRNFTSMADQLSPEETIEFQNAIFDPLIRIIEKNNGIIHQILGDGFMASFGVAIENPNHVLDAYSAGIQIVEVINHCRNKINGDKTRVGIGLHCGEVITGNIGNEIRKQFSIAGKNVIIAARIEQLNKQFESQFLVSKAVAVQLNENRNAFIDLGMVKVKGIDEKIGILQVL